MQEIPSDNYDAICFFNSRDRDTVRQIVSSLENRKLRVWFDEAELPPTAHVHTEIDTALKASRVAIVCVGQTGFGTYQEWENAGAIDQAIHRGMPLITVLLPGVSRDVIPRLPFTLTRNRPVQFDASPTEQAALDDIVWGITGRKPEPQGRPGPLQGAGRPPESAGPAQLLASELLRNGVTFFLGRRAALGAPGLPSCPSEVTVRLATDLGLFRLNSEHLLPPPDAMGELFATEYGIAGLEQAVFAAGGAPLRFPAIQDRLASIVGALQKRPKARAARKPYHQLIVTTSFDILIECAFLHRRLPFTRIVQSASQEKLYVSEVKELPDLDLSDPRVCENFVFGQPQNELGVGIAGADSSEIDTIDNFTLEGRPEPVLYKYHGSQDIPNTSAISTEQYYSLSRLQRLIPRQIRDIAINTSSVFVGCGMLDGDFQHLYHTMLRDGFDQRRLLRRYAVLEKPSPTPSCVYDEMALRVWNNLMQIIPSRTRIAVVDQAPIQFLDALHGFIAND
jgi:hypothetical protein